MHFNFIPGFRLSSSKIPIFKIPGRHKCFSDSLSSNKISYQGYFFKRDFAYLIVQNRCISVFNNFNQKPSSKLEETVQDIKEKEEQKQKLLNKNKDDTKNQLICKPYVLENMHQTSSNVIATELSPNSSNVSSKSLAQRIWEECVHYYHGFRLLFIDFVVCSKLLWRVLNGKTLTRREYRLLLRTTSDLFRLVPFSVFIIVPFMELLLPIAIKLFPGMLPSTFKHSKDEEDRMKQSLKIKLEMAKFLQKTLDEMSVQAKDHKSKEAKDFTEFFSKIRSSGSSPSNEDIMKFSKVFEDEITLDSLSRQQLIALCRVLEINTIGTRNFLQFQLRMKLRSLNADDRMIQKEGIDSLVLSELQSACRARGMRAYGMSKDKLKIQLQEWINLSLNERVPPSLLLLSRALMLPEHVPTSDKLKATISALPESIIAQTKAAIGERQGKIDNKTQIEIIKEEQRRIKEEYEERKESREREKEELLNQLDNNELNIQPINMSIIDLEMISDNKKNHTNIVSNKDIEVLGNALQTLSKDAKNLIIEKEEIKDLKEEIKDYEEDVLELKEVLILI